jgi:hypothetical protein
MNDFGNRRHLQSRFALPLMHMGIENRGGYDNLVLSQKDHLHHLLQLHLQAPDLPASDPCSRLPLPFESIVLLKIPPFQRLGIFYCCATFLRLTPHSSVFQLQLFLMQLEMNLSQDAAKRQANRPVSLQALELNR